MATSSIASINHFLGELFKLKAGITWTEVHYRGNAIAITDLLAGHVDVGFQQLVDAAQHLQSGKLRALAVPGKARAAAVPDVPTMAEAGYPEVEGVTFNGIFAPKATPKPVVEKLSAAIRAALEKKTAVDQLAALGSQARGSTPEEFTRFSPMRPRNGANSCAPPTSSRRSNAQPGRADSAGTEHGVIACRFYEDHPPRAEYLLTDKGRELGPVLKALLGWGRKHTG